MIAVVHGVHKEPIDCWRAIEDLAETLRDQATAALAPALGTSLVQR
jgi:hypothetical protein